MESVSASAGNPKEQRTMKQETGRQQPGIPFLQGGEDVKNIPWLFIGAAVFAGIHSSKTK